MHRLKAKQAWLENYIGRDLTKAQQDLLARFAAEDFLLIFDADEDRIQLRRVTQRTRRAARDRSASLALVKSEKLKSDRLRSAKHSAAKLSTARATPARPSMPAAKVPRGAHWSRITGSIVGQATDGRVSETPPVGFELGHPDVIYARVVAVNELVWQGYVGQDGGPIGPLHTPTDLDDAARNCERWVSDQATRKIEQMQFAKMQLDIMEMNDGDQSLIESEKHRVAECEQWLARFEQLVGETKSYQKGGVWTA